MSSEYTRDLYASLAARRFSFWDRESRARSLTDFESRELERAMRQMEHDENRRFRAQAGAPRPRRNGR